MSTVPASIFPATSLVLNELEAVTRPAAVHPKNLMLLCNQREVSSLTELKQTLPRGVWPQLRFYTETVSLYVGNFFDNVASGIPKYAAPGGVTTNWAGTPQHNLFRIAIILTDQSVFHRATEELIREQDDYWINLMRLRTEHYANIVESILLYRLLTERAVSLNGTPRSYTSAFANLAAAALQAEAGTENMYIMMDAVRFATAMRQSPMRLGSAGYIIFNQETPKLTVIPVALRTSFAPFANFIIGYTDYLVKTTTRYYINKFRVDSNKQPGPNENFYKVMYERYVSYSFPIFTSVGTTFTWAFRVVANNVNDVTTAADDAGGLGTPDFASIVSSSLTPF